jgi:acyl-CoA dehydrogenase
VNAFRFEPCSLPAEAEKLRQGIRTFLAEFSADWTAAARAQSWDGFDPQFSRAMGARGWIGTTFGLDSRAASYASASG